MKKLIIDCSKPLNDPERTRLEDFTPEEIQRNADQYALDLIERQNRPKTTEERLTEVEQELENLKGE